MKQNLINFSQAIYGKLFFFFFIQFFRYYEEFNYHLNVYLRESYVLLISKFIDDIHFGGLLTKIT